MFPCMNVVVAPLVSLSLFLSPQVCFVPSLGSCGVYPLLRCEQARSEKTALVCSCRQYYLSYLVIVQSLLYLPPNRPILPGSPRELLNSWPRRLGVRVLHVAHRLMTHDGVCVCVGTCTSYNRYLRQNGETTLF